MERATFTSPAQTSGLADVRRSAGFRHSSDLYRGLHGRSDPNDLSTVLVVHVDFSADRRAVGDRDFLIDVFWPLRRSFSYSDKIICHQGTLDPCDGSGFGSTMDALSGYKSLEAVVDETQYDHAARFRDLSNLASRNAWRQWGKRNDIR